MAKVTNRQGESAFLSIQIGAKTAPLGCNSQFTKKTTREKEILNCQANGPRVQSTPGMLSVDFDVSGTFIEYTSPDATLNWAATELETAAEAGTEVSCIVTKSLAASTVGEMFTGFIYDITFNYENGKPTKYQFSFSSNSETTYTIPAE